MTNVQVEVGRHSTLPAMQPKDPKRNNEWCDACD